MRTRSSTASSLPPRSIASACPLWTWLLCASAALLNGQDFLVSNARLIDGTGAPARPSSVRVAEGRIRAVGNLKPRPGETVIDAKGYVLAPGFIDLHNHSDRGLDNEPQASTQVAQGITTAVLGMDGGSPLPVAGWISKRTANPAAIHTMLFAGHASIRTKVMGSDYKRAATDVEIRQMAELVEQAMREGAQGLSTGLEYEVGSYSTTEEVVALARAAARHRGIYVSHIRDEADKTFAALREAVRIAEEARIAVHVSHIKLGTVSVWGKAGEAIRLLEGARRRGLKVTADAYPYDAWASTITVLIPDKQYENRASVEKGLADVGGAQNVLIVNCREHPDYEFRTLEEIAAKKGVRAADVFMEVVRTGGASVVCKSMTEADIQAFYSVPWIAVASDGGIGMRHPRAAGSFPRVLARFVREKRWLSIEEAVRKMTSLPAGILGLADRGRVKPGLRADLVLFDPDAVLDHSTFQKPSALAHGVLGVWVDGVRVWTGTGVSGSLPGKVKAGR